MSDKDHAAMLIKMAHKDLKAIQGMLDSNAFDEENFLISCSTVNRKSIKSINKF